MIKIANVRALLFVGQCIFLSAKAIASDTLPEPVSSDIVRTYAFDPSRMSFDEQAKWAPKLGSLWARFSQSPDTYRLVLRALLQREGGTEMLYCDGGMLFLNKAESVADQIIGRDAIKKCSLSEIQFTPYFYTLHAQAAAGVDTLDLQFRMLSKPKYEVFIPQHALTLGQDYAFLYPLLVQDERAYAERLIARSKTEKDSRALNTLLLALYHSATRETEAMIRSIPGNKAFPHALREQARGLINRIAEARGSNQAEMLKWVRSKGMAIKPDASEQDLRSARRKRMQSISDEALLELEVYTLLIYRVKKQ